MLNIWKNDVDSTLVEYIQPFESKKKWIPQNHFETLYAAQN